MRLPHLIHNAIDRLMDGRPHLVLLHEDPVDLFDGGMAYGAVLSEEEPALHRYMLWRVWDVELPVLRVMMLNPSKADHRIDDRTIETLITRARATGHGSILVINLFAWRATLPADMKKSDDPIGKDNDAAIEAVLRDDNGTLLCAWGVHGTHQRRNEAVLCRIEAMAREPVALRVSKDGHPEHPLYKRLEDGWSPFRVPGPKN